MFGKLWETTKLIFHSAEVFQSDFEVFDSQVQEKKDTRNDYNRMVRTEANRIAEYTLDPKNHGEMLENRYDAIKHHEYERAEFYKPQSGRNAKALAEKVVDQNAMAMMQSNDEEKRNQGMSLMMDKFEDQLRTAKTEKQRQEVVEMREKFISQQNERRNGNNGRSNEQKTQQNDESARREEAAQLRAEIERMQQRLRELESKN